MKRLVQNQSSFITKVHMCAYGMKIPDKEGNEFVFKPTRFLTNSPLLAAQLERRCDKSHQHARLASNRTKQAAIYPPQLIEAICNGINEQIKADKLDQNIVARIEYIEGSNVLAEVQKAIENAAKCHEEDHQDLIAFDDVSGAELDPKMVQKARRDEIEYVRSMNLYTKVSISECLAKTGKKPIAVRWIDVNKGDAKNPNMRSRVVGKEFNT